MIKIVTKLKSQYGFSLCDAPEHEYQCLNIICALNIVDIHTKEDCIEQISEILKTDASGKMYLKYNSKINIYINDIITVEYSEKYGFVVVCRNESMMREMFNLDFQVMTISAEAFNSDADVRRIDIAEAKDLLKCDPLNWSKCRINEQNCQIA